MTLCVSVYQMYGQKKRKNLSRRPQRGFYAGLQADRFGCGLAAGHVASVAASGTGLCMGWRPDTPIMQPHVAARPPSLFRADYSNLPEEK